MTVSDMPTHPATCTPQTWNACAILSGAQMRQAEALSCARGVHDYWGLMQVAGAAVARAVLERFAPCPVLVLCGPGNNGGDGYVAAEALRSAGWDVRVGALAAPTTEESKRAAAAWQGQTEGLSPALLDGAELVIDALFGIGLTRPLEGLAAQMVQAVTERGLPVVSADIPSGIDGDTGRVLGSAFQARATVTFFRKKRGHVLLPGVAHCGEVIVADTGLFPDVLNQINPVVAENDSALWASSQPILEASQNKYDRGHALIFGGAEMTGASRLAARAAQRMGAGMVTLLCPPESLEIYAKSLESVIVRPLREVGEAQTFLDDPRVKSVLIGPGLGRAQTLKKGLQTLILDVLKAKKCTVIDADALSIFEGDSPTFLDHLHEKCVLTPHSGEFFRLFVKTDKDKIQQTLEAAKSARATVLLKGFDTIIAHFGGFCVANTNAPPTLATAGSGDVLAGMILGLITAGMPCFEAACAAAHYHGAAARLHGPGLIAEDLIDQIPHVLPR